jgi:hypothetical protein
MQHYRLRTTTVAVHQQDNRLALMVIEAQSPIAELLAKHPVLLTKVVNDLQLALIHPPGNGDQQKAEWVENSLGLQSPLSRLRSYGRTITDSYRSSFRTIRGHTRLEKSGINDNYRQPTRPVLLIRAQCLNYIHARRAHRRPRRRHHRRCQQYARRSNHHPHSRHAHILEVTAGKPS